ncbi:uncharacterized protein UTRI_01820_B [Ustilago trichophora]|uniref:C3H1-type domain-containing protein n=1 Tax=Ustilago trichophora TaxID=86804 RepID=A0A5C3E343_9BASI|nr:uncharacterized protein UTRI_01820_B [Ustilago trichophora]
MDTGPSAAFDPARFLSNIAYPLPKPHHVVTSQRTHVSPALPPPLKNPEISQIWKADARRDARCLDTWVDDELELLGRLNLNSSNGDDARKQLGYRTPALTPVSLSDNGQERQQQQPCLSSGAALSSSPKSAVSYQSCPNLNIPRPASLAVSAQGHTAQEGPSEWAFRTNWQVDARNLPSPFHPDIGADIRASPSSDSAYGSDTDSSGPSSYGRQASFSPIHQRAGLTAIDTLHMQQLGFYNTRERNESTSSQGQQQTSQNPIRSELCPDKVDTAASPKLLAASSQASMLVSQLHSQRGLQYGKSMSNFIPVGLLLVQTDANHSNDWHAMGSFDGPSPKNRKMELYKTELCRNWEEKGSCEYGSLAGRSHSMDIVPTPSDAGYRPVSTFVHEYGQKLAPSEGRRDAQFQRLTDERVGPHQAAPQSELK